MTEHGEPDKKDRRKIVEDGLLSITLAVAGCLIVWLLTTTVAWHTTREAYGIRPGQWDTQAFLEKCDTAIQDYMRRGKTSEFRLEDFEPDQQYYVTRVFFRNDVGQ